MSALRLKERLSLETQRGNLENTVNETQFDLVASDYRAHKGVISWIVHSI